MDFDGVRDDENLRTSDSRFEEAEKGYGAAETPPRFSRGGGISPVPSS